MAPLSKQTIGNIGLYYVCYQLSRRGWNVLPTARNARGIDLVIYSEDAQRKLGIQVKALSKRSAVGLGQKPADDLADYWVICTGVQQVDPCCYILKPAQVRAGTTVNSKNGQSSYWLEVAKYAVPEFRERWDCIGEGS